MTAFKRYPSAKNPESGSGHGAYVPDDRAADAVNAALAARQPLLVTGEPGVGKTDLAHSVHWHLNGEAGKSWGFHKYVVRSDSRGRDVLYHYDHLRRLYDAQAARAVGDTAEQVRGGLDDHAKYIQYRALGQALKSTGPSVVLIDEIDKAPRDFPNDLLNELDNRELTIEETGEKLVPGSEPRLVIITSNAERELPEAFLRRCVFVRIPFPDAERLATIVANRTGAGGGPRSALALAATKTFVEVRKKLPEATWRKVPSLGELLRWIDVLSAADVPAGTIDASRLSELFPGVIVKNLDDARDLGLRL